MSVPEMSYHWDENTFGEKMSHIECMKILKFFEARPACRNHNMGRQLPRPILQRDHKPRPLSPAAQPLCCHSAALTLGRLLDRSGRLTVRLLGSW